MPVLSDPFASLFSSTAEFARLEEGLSGPGVTALFGLPPAGRMALAVQLSRRLGRPLCVVTAGEAEASRAAADLQALGLSAAVFPARDLLLRPIEGAGREYEYRRLAVLGGLVGGRVDAVCVPAEGLLQFTVPKAEFCANTLTLKPGMEIPQKQLAARLFGAGYVRRDRVEGPGQFSVRGGILDLYPPDRDTPARLEFWGDEIDTIHAFDLLTQRRGDALEKVYLSPAREVLFGDAATTAAGAVAADDLVPVTVPADKFTLVGNAFPVAVTLNGPQMTCEGIKGADFDEAFAFQQTAPQLLVQSAGGYDTYYYLNDAYVEATDSTKPGWADAGGNYVEPSVKVGAGFWVKSAGAITVQFNR